LGVVGAFIGRACEDTAKWIIFGWRSKRIDWDRVVAKHVESISLIGDPRTGPINIADDLGLELALDDGPSEKN